MLKITLKNDKRLISYLDDVSKRQIPYATSQAINDMLLEGKKAINEYQDKKYKGGATAWSKRGIGYVKSTKNFLMGIIHLSDSPKHEYLKFGIDGGVVHPVGKSKAIKVPSRNKGINKRGNFTFSGGTTFAGKQIQKGGTDPNYFIGIPKNIEKMPFYHGPNPQHYYGVWRRSKVKGIRQITMQIGFHKTRAGKKYLANPQNPAISRIKKLYNAAFARRLTNAIKTAN
ncbi:MAG: hypothetical protein ACO24D_13835 [bacterium]